MWFLAIAFEVLVSQGPKNAVRQHTVIETFRVEYADRHLCEVADRSITTEYALRWRNAAKLPEKPGRRWATKAYSLGCSNPNPSKWPHNERALRA